MLETEVFERLEEILEEIRNKSNEGTPILVEGKKDVKSLRELGIEGPIHKIPEKNNSILHSLENLSHYDEIIILTDFDRTGEELGEYCKIHLKRLDVQILSDLRNKLKFIVRKAVKDIEGLSSFMKSERTSKGLDKRIKKNK